MLRWSWVGCRIRWFWYGVCSGGLVRVCGKVILGRMHDKVVLARM